MIVEQLYTSCLSEAAYFIASEGEAAVVDPLRDVDTYLKMAEEKASRSNTFLKRTSMQTL